MTTETAIIAIGSLLFFPVYLAGCVLWNRTQDRRHQRKYSPPTDQDTTKERP